MLLVPILNNSVSIAYQFVSVVMLIAANLGMIVLSRLQLSDLHLINVIIGCKFRCTYLFRSKLR